MTKMIGIYSIDEHKEMMRKNVAGIVRNSGIGANTCLDQVITTTTDIIAGVIDTLYYELNGQKLSDFCPIEVGKGAYATKLLQYAINYKANAGKQGLVNPFSNGIAKDANSTIEIGTLTMNNNFWRWTYEVSNELVNIGKVNDQTFSFIEENEKARKKVWDLMLQDAWFLGLGDGKSYGLLNQPNVTVNTTLISAKLSSMTDAQFDTFLASAPNAFGANSAYTLNFNRMLIPTSDFYSLTKPYGQYGLNRLQVLEDAFKRVVGGDFKIVHAKYGENANAAGNGARYMFYNADADNICSYLPVPYTPMPLFPQGALDLISQAHGQFITPFVKRTGAVLYADQQVQ
jgi:hypothetical protein